MVMTSVQPTVVCNNPALSCAKLTPDVVNCCKNLSKTLDFAFIVLCAWNDNNEGGYLDLTKFEDVIVLKAIETVLK